MNLGTEKARLSLNVWHYFNNLEFFYSILSTDCDLLIDKKALIQILISL